MRAPPGNFRYSEIASEATLGQKPRAVVVVRPVLHPIFGCARMRISCRLTSNFQERRYLRLAAQQVG